MHFAKVAIILFLKRITYTILAVLGLLMFSQKAEGQSLKPDTLKTITDTLKVKSDTLAVKKQVDFPAFSVARDSVVEDFRNGRKMIYYYGDVKVNYENIELTSEYMEYDLDSRTVFKF